MNLFASLGSGFFLLIIGTPVAIALLLAPVLFLIIEPDQAPLLVVGQKIFGSINSFALMAVPFFILVGQVMNTGGITDRIFKFASLAVGPVRGGLGHVNIIASLLMSGMSGSAVADASGLGQVEIRAMTKQGYPNSFAAAVTAASATIGPIIPPSIPLVIFGAITGASISQLLLAGLIPGIVMGIGLMVVTAIIARRRDFPYAETRRPGELWAAFWDGLPALATPFILVGGIVLGVFTPTEAAAAAAIYAILIAVFYYRELDLRGLYRALAVSAVTTGAIMVVIAAAAVLAWLLTWLNLPQQLALALAGSELEKWQMLLLVNLFLLAIGCFLEANAALIFTAPLLSPLMLAYGVDPVHFGVILVMNLMLGLITPPIGMNMFIVTAIAKISAQQFIKAIWPFGLILVIVQLLITFVPTLSLAIPTLVFR